ncbi:Na+/H+ antiporter NhaA [Halioxenophilus sp. WMMB6]|uniref:Na+/H+ antiporter NhaA n=1 Tax=Halioxenophilus sp. WMMB6 TaxID=3073815 RepID=UPI00295E9C5B|nr:Na+/H+ antiporter NhaA [Halioxenophilus sp. WMMB6]
MIAKLSDHLSRFFALESAGGIVLMIAAALAMVSANSPLNGYYELLLSTPVVVQIGELLIAKPLLLWINDGLMATFFFLVGMELKRELVEGELSEPSNILLPAVGALGGMVVPALIYVALNHDDPVAISGWAIPAATDIAFALGVLSLLGSRVPAALKIFLISLAIFDDVGAIVIIALFYTAKVSLAALVVVAICLVVLALMHRAKVYTNVPYCIIGLIMWTAMLKSGVHATLTGVLLAMFIPIKARPDNPYSPLKHLEHTLHPWVGYLVLPLFAFANAGIAFQGMTWEQAVHGVPMGIALGLFLGKQLGIFGFCWLCIKVGLLKKPPVSWTALYGTAVLCGIGFTMSLFIGSLAFDGEGSSGMFDDRLGILLGSLTSGLVGYWLLNINLPKKPALESGQPMADNGDPFTKP